MDGEYYKALYEEEARRRQEAERGQQEEARRREEAERGQQEAERGRREEERLRREAEQRELQNRIQNELDRQALHAAITALQNENSELQQVQADQSVSLYLSLVSRLHTHLMRLIPLPQLDHPSGSNTFVTTAGRTSIIGKYYPLSIRAWTEFPTLHKTAFSRILAATANRPNFPSLADVRGNEKTLLEPLPRELLRIPKFLNEKKTSSFLDVALQRPSATVLRRFLEATGSQERLFFNCENASKTAESTGTDPGAGPGADPGHSSENVAPSEPPRTASPPNLSSPKASLKATPDCVLIAMSTDTKAQSADEPPRPPRWIAIGEHKPCHALRHSVVTQILRGPLPEAYMVRLAREAKARALKTQAQQSQAPSQDAGAQQPTPLPASGSGPANAATPSFPSSSKGLPRQAYFAHALTQTYHYMMVSGLEYGFLATGETLTFLRIPENDPKTLLYHTSVFPVPTPESVASFTDTVLAEPPSTAMDPADEGAFFSLPIAQLCSLSLLACETESAPRDALWISAALGTLAPFPSLPRSVVAIRDAPSPLGRRPRDSDDDDDGDADDRGRQPRPRTLPPPGPRHASQARTPSPLQHVSSVDESLLQQRPAPGSSNYGQWMRERGVARKPRLPYCTQACLRGLVQGGSLDYSCPNVLLHISTAEKAATETASTTHRITQHRLAELVLAQFYNGPEYDIECLSDKGYHGAIGEMLKITVTAYGYTFVAKGVDRQHRRRLRHEALLYAHLEAQQGSIVPVCLGLVDLLTPYPVRQRFKVLPHLLLMAYGGESVVVLEEKLKAREELAARKQAVAQRPSMDAKVLPTGVDLDREEARTLDELCSLGLYDGDDNRANLLWCAESGRVMRIDFERAVWLGSGNGEHGRADDGRVAKRELEDDSPQEPEKRIKRCGSAASVTSVGADESDSTLDQVE